MAHSISSVSSLSLSVLGGSRHDQVIHREPFSYVVVSNPLADETYEQLADEFPPLGVELVANQRANLSMSSLWNRSESLTPLWRSFVHHHTSIPFLAQSLRLLREVESGAGETRSWSGLLPTNDRWGTIHVNREGGHRTEVFDGYLGCQIAYHSGAAGSVVPIEPHVDRHNKLFSCLYYLRHVDDSSVGGDLVLWRWRAEISIRQRRELLRGSSRIPASLVEPVVSIPYRANQAVIFPNSINAIHGVSERSDGLMPRRFVFIWAELKNFDYRRSLLANTAMVRAARVRRRLRQLPPSHHRATSKSSLR